MSTFGEIRFNLQEVEARTIRNLLSEEDMLGVCKLEEGNIIVCYDRGNGTIGFDLEFDPEEPLPEFVFDKHKKIEYAIPIVLSIIILPVVLPLTVVGAIGYYYYSKHQHEKKALSGRLANYRRDLGMAYVNHILTARVCHGYLDMLQSSNTELQKAGMALQDLAKRYNHLCGSVNETTLNRHMSEMESAAVNGSKTLH